jgi:hypothetical protein
MNERFADCTIQWRDTLDLEIALISLDGTDNDDIFFCCNSYEEFQELCKEENGEDFRIIAYDLTNEI